LDGSNLEDRHLRPGRRAQHCTHYYETDDGQSHNESLDARGILVNRPTAFDKLLPIPSVDFALENEHSLHTAQELGKPPDLDAPDSSNRHLGGHDQQWKTLMATPIRDCWRKSGFLLPSRLGGTHPKCSHRACGSASFFATGF
jgi:hypothetical protein